MKYLLLALAIALAAPLAFGATTWTTAPGAPGVVGATDGGTGSEPTLDTDGMPLTGAGGFTVFVESTSPNTDGGYIGMTAGSLRAYLYNASSGRWSRAPDLDLTVAATSQQQSYSGFRVASSWGRIAYIPYGLVTPVKVYLIYTRPL